MPDPTMPVGEARPINGPARYSLSLGALPIVALPEWPQWSRLAKAPNLTTLKSHWSRGLGDMQRLHRQFAGMTVWTPYPIRGCSLGAADYDPATTRVRMFLFPTEVPTQQDEAVAQLIFQLSPESGAAEKWWVDALAEHELSDRNRLQIQAYEATLSEPAPISTNAARHDLARSPESFQHAFGLLGHDWSAAEREMARVTGPHEWEQAALACRAYCLKQLERHVEALDTASRVSSSDLGPMWLWYFHNTVAHALNMTDDLPAALRACDEAIEHFHRLASKDDVASFLALKANVLKQQAFPLSTDPDMYSAARPIISAAVNSLARSLALLPPDGDEMNEELDGMARIAARVGLDETELLLPERPESVRRLFEAKFNKVALQRSRALQFFNRGADAFNHRHYEDAASLSAQAFDEMPASEPNDTAFRALIAYQRGLALLRASGLEKVPPKEIPIDKLSVAAEIRGIWKAAFAILANLPADVVKRFNEELAPGATAAMANDRLMRGEILQTRGIDLANEGKKAEAARCLREALDLLDPRVPDHEPLIAAAHLRSASLLSDLGDRLNAADHARWVLEHHPPEKAFIREGLAVIAGVRPGEGGGMLNKEEFRLKFDSLVQGNAKALRVMRGASDVHSLNMDKVMEGGQRVFSNYDPELLDHITSSLRAGKQVAISAAGPDKVMILAAVGLFRG